MSTGQHSRDFLLKTYKELLKPRLFEEKMILLVRKGQLPKWFPGIGQEAVSVGATLAVDEDQFILTQHRNLGVFTSRGINFHNLITQFIGKDGGFTKGRDRSFYFAVPKRHHIIGSITHLGVQASVANGLALASKLKNQNKTVIVFCGDGGTSEGEWHEAVNLAAVWDLPVLFIIQNNGYALSTPTAEQYSCKSLKDRAIGYGLEGYTVDGNDILAVSSLVNELSKKAQETSKPIILECMTFRIYGHELSSGTKYVPQELLDYWAEKDPIQIFEQFLIKNSQTSQAEISQIKEALNLELDMAIDTAFSAPDIVADSSLEEAEIYAPSHYQVQIPSKNKSEERFIDAISDGLRESMQAHPNLIIMGQDIAEYGGVFKITEGFLEEFGKERVRNTPLCESAVVGAAAGLAFQGIKSVVEMQFADFVSNAYTQIGTNLSTLFYRTGFPADVVIRMPCGGGVGAGPFHSQSNEAWFTHCPGLKIIYPSSPYDAKGLLIAAINDPNPVLFFEHKKLYRSTSEEVPEGSYNIKIGEAKFVNRGDDVSVITYGMGVYWIEALKEELNYSIDLLDLRTLAPLDLKAIEATIKKTGRVLILHEASLTSGFGAELAAIISDNYFHLLDAPIKRCASLDTPVPFAEALETNYLAKSRISASIKELMQY